jgi:RNA polymerase sigma factor (sigma-70 family)
MDVVQDAMLRVIRSMPAMKSEKDLGNWLRAVVTSCAYDRLRKEHRRRRRETAVIRDEAIMEDALTERLAWLRSELVQLDAKVFPLLALRFRFGWTLERIGQAFGLKPGAVDGKIRRATKELRENWTESNDEHRPA